MSGTGGLLSIETNRVAGSTNDHKRDYTAVIIAGGEEIPALAVTKIDIMSDFENKYRDDISITLLLPLGTIITNIGPYQDDLSIRLRETITGEYDYQDITYKAYLMENIPNDIEIAANPAYSDFERSNRINNVNITFALTLPLIEYVDAIHTGTTVRQVPPFSVLKVLFSKYIESINFAVDEGITSLTMVEPSNYEPRSQIIIPHNTRLVDLPSKLQDELGGIYSSGLGFFISRRDIHFWPLYDTDRNEEVKSRLHLILPYSPHTTILDSTYRLDGSILTVIGSGEPRVMDDTLGQTYHQGDSVRFVDGSKAFNALGDVKDSTIRANRADRNIEVTAVETGKRITTVSGSSSHITSNIYKEMSEKAKLGGITILVTWRYSNHFLIKPGMITTLFMHIRDDVVEIPGIVLSISTKKELETGGIANKTMLSSSVISIFIKREDWRMTEFKKSGKQSNINTLK